MPSPIRVYPDADRVEEALLSAAAEGDGFADGSSFLTFGELVEALGGARALGRRPCSPLTARVVLWAEAQRLGPGPFGDFVQEPAFARAALELVFELKAGAVSAEDFARAAAQLPPSRQDRARFLARLHAAYEARMAELKLADREDAVRGALQQLERRQLPEAFTRSGRLELHDLYDFPPLRLELLLALARACEAHRVTLHLELPALGSAAVDMAVDPVLGAIERSCAELTYLEAHKTDLLGEGRPLAALGAHLYRPEAKRGVASALGERLELFSAASRTEECRQLARRVAALVTAGTPPEQIAIAYRDLDDEAERMVEALEELGIPARLRRGAPLHSTAAGRVALGLPLLVDDAFPADEVARLISSRYLPKVSRPEVSAPARWLQLASIRDDRVGARGEEGAYQVRLSALAERMDRRRAGSGWGARQLLERCQKLFAICRQLPAEATAMQHLTGWSRALADLDLSRALEQPEPRGAEGTSLGRAVLRALARDQAAADALRALYRELHVAFARSGAGTARISRRCFHRWLLDAAADFNLAPRGPRAGAVRVLELRQVVGRSLAHVCVGGLTDDRLPGRDPPSALFPDEDRLRVNQALGRGAFRLSTGEADGRAPWRVAEDRLLFALALAATRETVTLSYARLGAQGKEQIASPFLVELQRLTSARLEHRELSPVPRLDEAYTPAQLRERVAMEVYGRPELRVSRQDPAASAMGRHFAREAWLHAAGELVAVEEERLRFFSSPDREAGLHSGLVGTPELEPELRDRFLLGPDRPLSVSALGRYANCRFQGFAAFVLGLEEPDAPGEELAPKDKGSFWHQVLEELFPALREAGLLRRHADEVPDALVDAAVDRARASAEARLHVGHPALWEIDRERARAMVRRVLSTGGNGLPFAGHEPEHAELTFGRPDSPEGWKQVVIPGAPGERDVFVEGKIDRLDRGPSGWAVVDYKSGAVKRAELKSRLLETELQLPLYLLAARSAGARHAVHAAWLGLKDGEALSLAEVVEAAKAGTLEELLATDPASRRRAEAEGKRNLASAVHSVVADLRRGRFPARPKDCRGCSFRAVCRIGDRRLEEEVVAP